ncbi:hypothetical protein CDAR_171671 [Caerostris darwini]|uniref:Uncharacterized protein n=1 Tax=Caerostris darwini TaxID=1538125 RepID=A0AAV4QYQ7_9ARAC|nr:hypothetical protein CDAR_171671 [Caerostris darwini]
MKLSPLFKVSWLYGALESGIKALVLDSVTWRPRQAFYIWALQHFITGDGQPSLPLSSVVFRASYILLSLWVPPSLCSSAID